MNDELKEYQQRREWLKEAARMVEADEVQPVVIEHTLTRFMHTPVRTAVVYSDTGEYETMIRRERAGYFADIAALEAVIKRRRDNENTRALIEAINELKTHETKRDEQMRHFLADNAATAGGRHTNYSYLYRDYPAELDTPIARYVLNRFADDGIISKDGVFYKWERTKSHFEIFGRVLSAHKDFELTHSNGRIKWEAFAAAFRMTTEERRKASVGLGKRMSAGRDPLIIAYSRAGGYIPYNFKCYLKEWEDKLASCGQPSR